MDGPDLSPARRQRRRHPDGAANPDLGSFVFDPDYPAADDRYQHLRPVTRREAYQADITYGTNNEFGFDYLRDNMVQRPDAARPARPALRHRRRGGQHPDRRSAHAAHHLRRSAQESSDYYAQLRRRSSAASSDEHDYTVDEKERVVTLTEEGIAHVESMLGLPPARTSTTASTSR